MAARPTVPTTACAALLQQALGLIHAGQLSQAAGLCRQALAREPQNFNALQLLGHVTLQGGDYASAVTWLAAARAVNPANARLHSNLAVALLGLKRSHEALQCCDTAIGLDPKLPEARCNQGNALMALDRPSEALAAYMSTLALAPSFYDAYVGRSNALVALGRYDDALSSCERAQQIVPQSLEAWCLRGSILLRLKRAEEALAAFDRALSLNVSSAEAHNNRGTALRELKRFDDALVAYWRALELRPEFAEVFCNVANIGLDRGHIEAAVGYCDRALSIRPGFLEALNIRGTALRLLKRYSEAASTYATILQAAPDYGQAASYLLSSRASLADWSGRTDLVERIVDRVAAGNSASSPHAFLWITDSAEAQLQCAQLYSRDQYPVFAPLWRGERYRHERLRIAYLSADFSDHPVAHLIAGVLERHDRSRFETMGVALYRDPNANAMQLRMRNAFDHFYDAADDGDRQIATRLREREIDIVVDLTGHTRNGRLGVLAHRPAPVHINYLGFAGTSGAEYVDYIIGDQVTIPHEAERFFSERLICMPHSFLPNDDAQPIARDTPRRAELGLPEAGFVFCAFNNIYKINPTMFDLWMRLLHEAPGSVLWLRAEGETVVANLKREARIRGVASDRLIFASRIQSMDAHLARYRQADLFLDTLPYGAHATARDALWAGLPVLTCTGRSFASRVAASLLHALDLPELITSSCEEYATRALDLAHSPVALAELRTKLAHQRAISPAFDTDLYRQHLESAYLSVRRRQREGELPGRCNVSGLA
jgi:predicted O-linked N-acetylglucosamine transferase (SPINDLY family)